MLFLRGSLCGIFGGLVSERLNGFLNGAFLRMLFCGLIFVLLGFCIAGCHGEAAGPYGGRLEGLPGVTVDVHRGAASGSDSVIPDGEVVELYSGDSFYEAACWDEATGKLYFAGWGDNSLQFLRLDEPGVVTVLVDDTAKTIGINGARIGNDGRMLTAQVMAHKVVSYKVTESKLEDTKTLAHNAGWQQPNDLCVGPGGNIYFSDPQWGGDHSGSAVYLLRKSGEIVRVADDMQAPNGLAVSQNGEYLYVADSLAKHWRRYEILSDGWLGEGEIFYSDEFFAERAETNDLPDGMAIDSGGNLYFTGLGGVRVVSPGGELLWMVAIDEKTTNVSLDSEEDWLFITCSKKVYGLRLE